MKPLAPFVALVLLAPASLARANEAEVLAALAKMRAEIVRDEKRPGKPVVRVAVLRPVGDSPHLAHLAALSELEELDLSFALVGDVTLPHVAKLANLRRLDLHSASVSDRGLSHLAKLGKLENLNLASTKVSGTGIAHLKGLTCLKELDLSETNVNDAGLAHLKGLANLEVLSLGKGRREGAPLDWRGLALPEMKARPRKIDLRKLADLLRAPVGDAGLAHLKGLPKLRELNLSATRVTRAGLADFARAKPRCVVRVTPPPR